MEVCGILNSLTDGDLSSKISESDDCKEKERKKDDPAPKATDPKKQNPFASLKAKLCSAHIPKSYLTRIAVNKSIGLLSDIKNRKDVEVDEVRRNSDQSICAKKELILCRGKRERNSPKSLKHQKSGKDTSFSKSTGHLVDKECKGSCNTRNCSNLRIKICKCPSSKFNSRSQAFETDSSNEYESETGIPKSPTLFISGVSISRTPEPKSPGIALISGRQSRSSSLSVPVPLTSCSQNISTTSLNNTPPPEPFTPSLVRSATPASSKGSIHGSSPKTSPSRSGKENAKSKSASEPEREREMFRFPKSSTDGALSSVLHVQESNLSSDDFHEALFLLERSPKSRDSKRRKKSKKKDKEDRKEEDSSAL